MRFFAACLALLACGCNDLAEVDGSLDLHDWLVDLSVPDLSTAPPGDMAAAPPGAIDGVVLDFLGGDRQVVPGAVIAVTGIGSVVSDANGRFLLGGIPASSAVTVHVSRPDAPSSAFQFYSTLTLVTQVTAGQTTHLTPRLLQACAQTVAIVAGTAGSVDLTACGRPDSYASIAWEADGLTAGGVPFAGNAVFAMMPVPFPRTTPVDLSWFVTVPGDGTGVTQAGAATLLDGFGAAEFRIFDAAMGAPITVGSGHQVTITLEMFAPAPSGETPSAWRFDDASGKWKEQGAGDFFGLDPDGGVPDGGVAGFDLFRFQTGQLGWWASAAAVNGSTRGCVRGRLSVSGSDGGVPASGVAVVASGATQGSVSTAVTAGDGRFCLSAPGGASVNVSAVVLEGGATLFRAAGKGIAGAAGHACGDTIDACADLGDFELDAMLPVCTVGRTRRQGCYFMDPLLPITEPLSLFTDIVVAPTDTAVGSYSHVYLGVVTPGSDGRFCTELTPGQSYTLVEHVKNVARSFTLPAGTNAGSCGIAESSCDNIGELDYFCGY